MKKLLILRDIGREGEGKELHLLAPTSTIHPPTFAAFNFKVVRRGGGYILQGWNFSTNEGLLRNFSELLKLPKNVPNYLQPGNLNNSLEAKVLEVHLIFNLSGCAPRHHFLLLHETCWTRLAWNFLNISNQIGIIKINRIIKISSQQVQRELIL